MRKYFEVINTVTWFDDDYENEKLVLTPGQIVEIELDDVPNFYPCLVLDNDMLDIAFDTWEEFYEFFKEFDNDREMVANLSDRENKTLVMKLNTGENIIILLDRYNVNLSPVSTENIDLWRVTKETSLDTIINLFDRLHDTWPDELEYIECKRAYSDIVKSELDLYLLLNDEEAWNELYNN